MKELNIIEAMNMPVGTEFEVFSDGRKLERKFKINDINELVVVYDNDYKAPRNVTKEIINYKFIPIPKLVNFMKAVQVAKEGKRVKVKHEKYYEFKDFKDIGKVFECIIDANKEFGDENVNKAIIKNILEGEWYIEG